jgi:hypothetical protein
LLLVVPGRGQSLLIAEISNALHAAPFDPQFWATHAGAELGVFTIYSGQRLGFETKRTTTPRMADSPHSAIDTSGSTMPTWCTPASTPTQ